MKLVTNTRRFKDQLRRLRNATDEPLRVILRGYMIYLLGTVAQRTPVSPFEDEAPGRLAGSWTISRDHPGMRMIPKGQSSSAEEAIENAQSLQFSNPYAVWYLYNRVEYGEVVEYGLYPGNGPRTAGGYSTQAPEGMLRLTMAEAKELLTEIEQNVLARKANS